MHGSSFAVFSRGRDRLRAKWWLIFGLTACSVVVDGRIRPGDAGGGFDGGFDASTDASVDGAPDAPSVDAPDVGTDAPTVDAGPPCDPSEAPNVEGGVFASSRAPNDEGDGGPTDPTRTLARAFELAAARGATTIYLDAGTFTEGVLAWTLESDLTISGGWRASGGTWTRDCSDAAIDDTVVELTNLGLNVTSTGGDLTLSRLTIRSADAVGPGGSSYGVRFRSDEVVGLNLDRARIVAGRGANGVAGVDGRAGAMGVPTNVCEDGLPRGNGADGEPGVLGTFEPNGYGVALGGAATDGMGGKNGTSPTTAPQSGSCLPGCAGECQTAGGVCLNGIAETRTANPGQCGGGGGPGTRGTPGGGGGGSFALYTSGFNVVVTSVESRLVSGDGGDGGEGGEGGEGGTGADGRVGTSVICNTQCGASGPWGPTCSCGFTMSRPLMGGSAGGRGADGGRGGDGGGGAGGPSAAVVLVGGARFVGDAERVPGAGGAGAGGAAEGTAAEELVR